MLASLCHVPIKTNIGRGGSPRMFGTFRQHVWTNNACTCESVSTLIWQVLDGIDHSVLGREGIQVPLDPWVPTVLGQTYSTHTHILTFGVHSCKTMIEHILFLDVSLFSKRK